MCSLSLTGYRVRSPMPIPYGVFPKPRPFTRWHGPRGNRTLDLPVRSRVSFHLTIRPMTLGLGWDARCKFLSPSDPPTHAHLHGPEIQRFSAWVHTGSCSVFMGVGCLLPFYRVRFHSSISTPASLRLWSHRDLNPHPHL